MRILSSFTAVFMLCVLTTLGQSSVRLNPTPRQMTTAEKQTVSLPSQVAVVRDKVDAGSYAMRALETLFDGKLSATAGYKVIAGVKGNKAVKAYASKIPAKAEGYYLKVEQGKIIAAGYDERGLFYAVQTLRQLIEGGALPVCEITDYPDIKHRGIVEGFYGTPWSNADRERQLDFYGRNKLNVYIYGPKDDKYHSVPNWRKPYPTDEAEQIKALVKRAHDNGVMFYWAIHPGQDIKWTDEDRDNVIHKFELMYDLGVRAFAVFFDDISGEGTKAEKQAELLNYIDNNFVKKKKDVEPLMMCPTEYNKSWANVKGGYLTTLGTVLNPDIEIMWTGNTVVACIDKPTMDWINPLIKRKAYIWWNFPVSDYVRDHLLLGATYGNALDIKDDMSGFVANPMERAEASKISLYSVADYTWNMAAYDSTASWHAAIADLLPGDADALLTFARHNSDLGQNGHRFRRVESENIEKDLERLRQTRGTEVQSMIAVANECVELERAADVLLSNRENTALIAEMRPWLMQARLVGEYGQQVLNLVAPLAAGNSMDFLRGYRHAKALQQLMYKIDTEENQNPYQPGVKVGSRLLMPTLNSLFSHVVSEYNTRTGSSLDTAATYIPFMLQSTVAQLASLPVSFKGLTASVSPSNEVIQWNKGETLTITCIGTVSVKDLVFNLGKADVAQKFRLETLGTDGRWTEASLTQAQGSMEIKASGLTDIKALRITQTTDAIAEVFFKSFKIAHSAIR